MATPLDETHHPPDPAAPPADPDSPGQDTVSITVTLGPRTTTFELPAAGTLDDLTLACEDFFDTPDSPSLDWTTHKFIAPPPAGLLKAEARGDFPLAGLAGKKLRLLAARVSEVDALRAAEHSAARRRDLRSRRGAAAPAKPRRTAATAGDSTYTFQAIRALPHLPRPERSLALLQRVAADRGIRAAMQRRRFTVGLLTEMDPAQHTDLSADGGVGRTLGLNRNRGEVIELRLRTDAGDGYRDYRTIRRTLCHELAHNVHGPHDRAFWDLCHAIEREVEAEDWASRGGRTVGDGPGFADAYEDEDEDHAPDHGGWTGGEFVLGGGPGPAAPLTRREMLARAAEQRKRRVNDGGSDGDGDTNHDEGPS